MHHLAVLAGHMESSLAVGGDPYPLQDGAAPAEQRVVVEYGPEDDHFFTAIGSLAARVSTSVGEPFSISCPNESIAFGSSIWGHGPACATISPPSGRLDGPTGSPQK